MNTLQQADIGGNVPPPAMYNPTQTNPFADDPFRPFAQELWSLITEHVLLRVDSARQFQLTMALRNELFWRAKQYLKFKFTNNGMTIVPIQGPPGATGDINGMKEPQALSYVFNVTRADGQKFVAITGSRAPHVTYTARDSHDPDSLKAGRDGKAVGRFLEELWDSTSKQKDIARTVFRSGPQFGHVSWVTDEDKYGAATVTETQLVDKQDPAMMVCQNCGDAGDAPPPGVGAPVCPACGSSAIEIIPGAAYKALEAISSQKIPRGMPELHLYSIFDVNIPADRKTINECEWLNCETLEMSGKLRQLYGKLVEQIKDETVAGTTTPSQQTVIEAHSVIASADPQETTRIDRWWWTRTWLQPAMYHYASPGLKAALFQNAPNGLRSVFVNGNYVEAVGEDLRDVWEVCKTGTDDRILGDPICHDLIPINEIINNFFNLAIETVLRAIPKTIVNPRLVDRSAIINNQANVAEVLFAKTGLSEDFGGMIAKLPQASFSEQMMELATLFRQYSREIDGVMEAAFGGGDPAPTWRQDQQRKNQALAQFYVTYDEMRSFWKGVHRKSLGLLSKFGVGTVSIPSDDTFSFGPNVVDLTTLTPEKVKIEAEETIPLSRAEEADSLRDQLQMPPQFQEGLGIFHPVNIPRIADLLQTVRGIKSPYADLVEKTIQIIEKLAGTEPMPATDPTGQPQLDPTGQPVLQPSIAPDPFEFKNATLAVEVVRAWVNSPAGIMLQQSQPKGFQNIKLFGQALDKMASPPPPGPEPPKLNFTGALDKLSPEQVFAIEKLFNVPVPPPAQQSPPISTTPPRPHPALPAPPPGGPPAAIAA